MKRHRTCCCCFLLPFYIANALCETTSELLLLLLLSFHIANALDGSVLNIGLAAVAVYIVDALYDLLLLLLLLYIYSHLLGEHNFLILLFSCDKGP